MARLMVVLGIFGLLAFSAIRTLSEPRIRTVTLLILGMFAVLSITGHLRRKQEANDEASE